MPSYLLDDVEIELIPAAELKLPSAADCNSPCWWHDGTLYLLTSTGHPLRLAGASLETLSVLGPIHYTAYRDGGRWIESVLPYGGALYGWYHNEPAHLMPPEMHIGRQFPMTAPLIGAAVSYDQGASWDDLGLIIAGGPETLALEAPNYWFAGGNGDFTVITDCAGEYLYFVFGCYYRDVRQQGVALARLALSDIAAPVGKVYKWHAGAYCEPGLNGALTPILPVAGDWYGEAPDAFWGPSVHWNSAISRYVILLNRAVDRNWKQGGIYLCLARDVGDPASWSAPVRLLEAPGWYPQVIGLGPGESDREVAGDARLFIHGVSRYQIRLSRA